MIQAQDLTGARAQATIVTVGLFTFVSVGLAACLALVMAVFYLVVSLALVMLQAIGETFATIASTWAAADPFLKILILGAVVYGSYRLYKSRQARKGGKHA